MSDILVKLIEFFEEKDLQPVEKQLPIDDASRARLIDVRVSIFNDMATNLTEDLYNGNITLGAWEERMKTEVKALHSSAAAVGKGGWENMTPSDWGKVGAQVKSQYRYLHGFAEDIAETRDTLSLGYTQARARMYGNAARNTAAVVEAGIFTGSRRQPSKYALPWMPGDGSTQCLTNCKCHWESTVSDKTKTSKLVTWTWTLGEAEHCPDCVDREGHQEFFEVPIDTDVPASIGVF